MGALWIHFDVFSQLTLHFAILAVAFLVGFFMPRARVLTAVVLSVSAMLAISIYAHKVSSAPRPVAAAAANELPVRLLSFNTWFKNRNVDEIASVIEREDADIVGLVEFGPNKKPLFDRLKSRYPYQFSCLNIEYCNLVFLSKFPFAEPPEAKVNWAGPAYARARFGPELGGLTVYIVHTLRFPHQRAQFTQLGELAKLLETQAPPVIVMGDFNATPFSRQTSTFAARTRLQRLTYLPSWPARLQLPQLSIDHVFASPSIRVLEDQRILANAGSDHNPITLGVGVPR
jgi:endonuclease/exonuclease/phosphatase (EEP) superfamily protein YafD